MLLGRGVALKGAGGGDPNGLLTDLVAYWKLDESSGTRVDSAGTYNLSESASVSGTSGLINNGASITSGSTNYLYEGSTGALNTINTADATNPLTFNVWINPASFGSYKAIFEFYGTSGNGRRLSIFIDSPSSGYIEVNNAWMSGISSSLTFSPTWSTSEWQMMTVVCNSSGVTLYRNATSCVIWTGNAGRVPAGDGRLYLGSNPSGGGSAYSGIYDEAGLWGRALSTDDITALYNGGSGLPYSSFTS